MRFSLGFPEYPLPVKEEFLTPDFLIAFCRAAEEARFDAVSFTEHPIPNRAYLESGGQNHLDPFVGLACAATVTRTILLLTATVVLPYRNPFLLAKAVATLDRFSGGRVILGVGTGHMETEFQSLGVDLSERNDLFEEALDVCRQTWAGESVTYNGLHFAARECIALPTPAQDRIPIWIGGNSKRTRNRVVEQAQGWMPIRTGGAMAQQIRTAPLDSLGDLAAMITDMNDHAAAIGRTEPMEVLLSVYDDSNPDPKKWSADQVIENIRAQAEAGVTWQDVRCNPFGNSPAEVFDMIRRFGEEVIPVFR